MEQAVWLSFQVMPTWEKQEQARRQYSILFLVNWKMHGEKKIKKKYTAQHRLEQSTIQSQKQSLLKLQP